MTGSNKDFLPSLFQIVNNSSIENKTVKLTEEKIAMLNENDILTAHTKLDNADLK
jgi:hypothetical protein